MELEWRGIGEGVLHKEAKAETLLGDAEGNRWFLIIEPGTRAESPGAGARC